MDVPGIAGELGALQRPDGGVSDTISITVTDPRINGGRPTNVPLLAQGQEDVQGLLEGKRPTEKQDTLAILRAVQRQMLGERVPSYPSIDEAINAAKAFSAQQSRRGDYLRRQQER